MPPEGFRSRHAARGSPPRGRNSLRQAFAPGQAIALIGPGARAVLRAAGPGARLIDAQGRVRPARGFSDRFAKDPEAAWRRAARSRAKMLLLEAWPRDIDALRRAVHATGAIAWVLAPDVAAAATADVIAVCDGAMIVQAGDAATLRAAPRTRVVAEIFGPVNVLSGTVREMRADAVVCVVGRARVLHAVGADRPRLGDPVALCLRPERLTLAGPAFAGNVLDGVSGPDGFIHTDAGPLRGEGVPEGVVRVGWRPDATVLLAA